MAEQIYVSIITDPMTNIPVKDHQNQNHTESDRQISNTTDTEEEIL